MLTKCTFSLMAWVAALQTVSSLLPMNTNRIERTSSSISAHKLGSPLLIRGLRGGDVDSSPPADEASEVSIKFLKRNVSNLQSYLSYLQEYQNPMVARAWPANTNFVSVTETVTDTVFRNSLRAESKGLVYREWVRAGPRKQTLFTPSEVNAAIVACGGLDPGINVVVREICSTLDFAYNVRRAWGVRYGWRGFTDKAAQVLARIPMIESATLNCDLSDRHNLASIMRATAAVIPQTLAGRNFSCCARDHCRNHTEPFHEMPAVERLLLLPPLPPLCLGSVALQCVRAHMRCSIMVRVCVAPGPCAHEHGQARRCAHRGDRCGGRTGTS